MGAVCGIVGNVKPENEQLAHGLKILKIAAARLDVLEKSSTDSDPLLVRSVSAEYYMLRIYLVIDMRLAGRNAHTRTRPGFKGDPTSRTICFQKSRKLFLGKTRGMSWKRVAG